MRTYKCKFLGYEVENSIRKIKKQYASPVKILKEYWHEIDQEFRKLECFMIKSSVLYLKANFENALFFRYKELEIINFSNLILGKDYIKKIKIITK